MISHFSHALIILVSMHRELIHIVILQIIKNSTIVSLRDQGITVLLGSHLVIERTWTADTSAVTCHTFDEVFRKTSNLHEKEGFLTFLRTICTTDFRIDAVVRFFQTFQNGCCYTAGICKAFSEGRSGLVVVRTGLIARISLYVRT